VARSVITEEQARSIKLRIAGGEGTCAVARSIGCSFHVVSQIRNGKTWRHVA
jgi:hypothetical protein